MLFFSHDVMSEKDLEYDGIRDALFSAFPELLERIWITFGSYYKLENGKLEDTPGAYPIFEDVVQELVFELLDRGQDDDLLARLFLFFERMATTPDKDVRDLLAIAIVENLVYRKESLREAWKLMGPKSKELAVEEANRQGRRENLPRIENPD
jgi:hypothetical protein